MNIKLNPHQCQKLMPFIVNDGAANEVCISVPLVRAVLGVSPEVIQQMPFYLRPGTIEEGGYAKAAYVLDEMKFNEFVKRSSNKGRGL